MVEVAALSNEVTAAEWRAVDQAWVTLVRVLGPLSAKASDGNAQRMMFLADQLLDRPTQMQQSEGLSGLLNFVTEWIEAFEGQGAQIEPSDPVDVLIHLMQSNSLKQKDLATELGGQPVVSAVLKGHRKINARQAVALGKRFAVSAALFLESSDADSEHADSEHAPSVPMPTWVRDVIRTHEGRASPNLLTLTAGSVERSITRLTSSRITLQ
jgi:HTH-type transcriptional regulator / antitoxin HigA